MTDIKDMTVERTVDRERWPDVAAAPIGGLRAAIVAAMIVPLGRRLGVRVALPDGRMVGDSDPHAPVMRMHRPAAVCARFGVAGSVGLGESYQAGDWDADDLPRLLETVAGRMVGPVPAVIRLLRLLRRLHGHRGARSEANTIDRAWHNVRHHYDLSNELFALFLDETMTYSCALFDTDGADRPVGAQELLTAAQRRKIDRVLDLVEAGPGTRLLEIGTGWGELAIAAARRGASVHTVTLSAEQHRLARDRVTASDLTDRVLVELCDYRDIVPRYADGYDAIVSVEMIEAVGEQSWPVYFKTLDRLLAPGGRIGLQSITMRHEHLLQSRDTATWIDKYIFPGGLIPSVHAMDEVCRRHTSLRMRDAGAFGAHYAQTLRLWRERFHGHRDEVDALGFDETFRRTWHLYLSYCEAGFAGDYIDVHHLTLERNA